MEINCLQTILFKENNLITRRFPHVLAHSCLNHEYTKSKQDEHYKAQTKKAMPGSIAFL